MKEEENISCYRQFSPRWCTVRTFLSMQSAAFPVDRKRRENFQKSFILFFIYFFLSLVFCCWTLLHVYCTYTLEQEFSIFFAIFPLASELFTSFDEPLCVEHILMKKEYICLKGLCHQILQIIWWSRILIFFERPLMVFKFLCCLVFFNLKIKF